MLHSLISFIVVTAQVPLGQEMPTREQLAALLVDMERRNAVMDTTFEYRETMAKREDQAGESWPTADDFVEQGTVRWLQRDHALRFESEVVDPKAPDRVHRFLSTWDGETFRLRQHLDKSFVLKAAPESPDMGMGYAGVFNQSNRLVGDAVMSQGGLPSLLSDVVRASDVVRQSVENGVLAHSYRIPGSTVLFTLRVAFEPCVHVVGYGNEVKREDGHLMGKTEWTASDWRWHGELYLPDRALRDTRVFLSVKGHAGLHRAQTHYRRISAADLRGSPPRDAEFVMSPEIGEVVADERLRLVFTVGGNLIMWDGIRYETPEKILDHPGEGLAALIQRSRRIDPPAKPSTGSTESGSRWRARILGGAAVLALMIAVWGLLKGKKENAPVA